jgi:hypothetical protein
VFCRILAQLLGQAPAHVGTSTEQHSTSWMAGMSLPMDPPYDVHMVLHIGVSKLPSMADLWCRAGGIPAVHILDRVSNVHTHACQKPQSVFHVPLIPGLCHLGYIKGPLPPSC